MPDKTEDIELPDDIVGIAVSGPDYDNKEIENEGPECTDKFISFRETDHEHPYDNPFFLKIEDIFGWMMCYRKPYDTDDRKSLKNYRNRLRGYCKTCYRLPSMCHRPIKVEKEVNGETKMVTIKDKCRIRYLKVAMTREIKGTEIWLRPIRGLRLRLMK